MPRGPRQGSARAPAALALVAGVVALLVASAVAVTIGPTAITIPEVIASIAGHLGFAAAEIPAVTDTIVWELRLPRVITAAAVGAGLALSGAIMQSVTRNPLADPYLLGLSSGASFGAVLVLVIGVSVALPIAAFVGALAALVASLAIARSGGAITPGRAVLAGLAIAQLAGAATSFVIFWNAQGDSYREILNWLLGSLAGSDWTTAAIATIALAVVGTALVLAAPRLDAFTFGDTAAASLGIDVNLTRWVLLTGVALLTGAMVAVSGAIGFVGLILPHLVRSITGPAHRRLLPLVVVLGALFLVIADTLARTVFDPRELPVGIITAVIGVPVFVLLFTRRKGAAWA